MKALKNIGYVLLLVVLGLALIGLYLPGGVSVERRLEIAAPPAALFPLLDSPQAFTRWSPWSTPGAGVRYGFDGPATGVGATLQWQGGAFPMGSGSYTITDIDPDRRVEMRFLHPLLGKTHSTLELAATPDAAGTLVAWRFYDDVGFNLPRRLLWLLADLTMGPQLERGLDNLRALAGRR